MIRRDKKLLQLKCVERRVRRVAMAHMQQHWVAQGRFAECLQNILAENLVQACVLNAVPSVKHKVTTSICLHPLTGISSLNLTLLFSSRSVTTFFPNQNCPSSGYVGDAVLLVDSLHDACDDLVWPNLDAALQALAQQSLDAELPLDRRCQLQTKGVTLSPPPGKLSYPPPPGEWCQLSKE